MNDLFCGIDIGGTKTAFGLFAYDGNLLKKAIYPTPKTETAELFLDFLAGKYSEFRDQYDIKACGMAIPGTVDIITGIPQMVPNIPCLDGFDIAGRFSGITGVGCVAENDANAAGLAEFKKISGIKNMIYITLSTGIGGAIIINGELFYGDSGTAGEPGHIVVNPDMGGKCSCGNKGCIESICSGVHIQDLADSLSGKYPDSVLLRGKADGRSLSAALAQNDPMALEIRSVISTELGKLCYNIYRLLGINTYVIGGGLITHNDDLFPYIKESFFSYFKGKCSADLKKAVLGEDSGIYGAFAVIPKEKNR